MRFGKGKTSTASSKRSGDGASTSGDDDTPIYYFSYGALVNPIARQRRGVCADEAQAALLPNYRLSFACGGAANITPKQGWEVYGIVMKCSSIQDWNLLKDFDAGYDCIEVDVFPLREATSSAGDGAGSASLAQEAEGFAQIQETPIRARVFVMPEEKKNGMRTDRLPQERYLRLIASGMKAYGVDEDYIDDEIMSAAYIPNRKPDNYLRFPPLSADDQNHKPATILSLPAWNRECQRRLSRAAKSIHPTDKNLILFRLGEHAIQVNGEDAGPDNPFCVWLRDRLLGPQDSTWLVVQTHFDPDLPLIASPEEVTPAHQAWAENQMMEKFEQAGVKATVIYQVRLDVVGDGILQAAMSSMHSSIRSLRTSEHTTTHSKACSPLHSGGGGGGNASQTTKKKQWSPKLIQSRVQLIRSNMKLPTLRSSSSRASKSSSQQHSNNEPLNQPCPGCVSGSSVDASTSVGATRSPKFPLTTFANSSNHFSALDSDIHLCNHADKSGAGPPITSLFFSSN